MVCRVGALVVEQLSEVCVCVVERQFDSDCVLIFLVFCDSWLLALFLFKVWFDSSRPECGRAAREHDDTVFIVHTKKGEGSCLMTCLIS